VPEELYSHRYGSAIKGSLHSLFELAYIVICLVSSIEKYHNDSSETSYEEADTGCDHKDKIEIKTTDATGNNFVFLGLKKCIISLDYHLEYYFNIT
jgi:hypothetical protein